MDEFRAEAWAQQCRQVAARDYDASAQVECLEYGFDGDDRGQEHAQDNQE